MPVIPDAMQHTHGASLIRDRVVDSAGAAPGPVSAVHRKDAAPRTG